jgi:hypothetical protein
MKNVHLRLLSVAAFIVVAAIACKKDKDDSNGKFSATINGTAFQPSTAGAVDEYDYITISGVQGQSGDSVWLSLDIPDTAHVNTPISFEDGRVEYATTKNSALYYSSGNGSHGSTTISSWDKTNKKITGKFSGVVYPVFNATDSIVITNGQFNINYQ